MPIDCVDRWRRKIFDGRRDDGSAVLLIAEVRWEKLTYADLSECVVATGIEVETDAGDRLVGNDGDRFLMQQVQLRDCCPYVPIETLFKEYWVTCPELRLAVELLPIGKVIAIPSDAEAH